VALVVVALLVVGSLMAGALALTLGAGGGRAGAGHTGGAHLPPAVSAFEQLLAASAAARLMSDDAVAGACKASSPEDARREALVNEMGRAIDLRRSLVSNAEADQRLFATFRGGQAALQDFVQAAEASMSADRDYMAWLGDLQATGCYGGPTNDLNYRAGAAAWSAATRAGERLVSAWGPIATLYKARTWLPSQI
jgi:hypothetical protein